MKLGIMGFGNIGSALAEHAKKLDDKIIINYHDKFEINKKNINKKDSIEQLFIDSDAVVEAAHPSVVKECLSLSLKYNKSILIMSTGGLLGNEKLIEEIKRKKIKLIIPSGAIAGMDAVSAAALGGIKEVTLTSTKNPKSLGLELNERKTIFSGIVEEAVKKFPKNINVAATLALASKFKDLEVEIVADPAVNTNNHEVTVEGDFGRITTKTENVPSPNNPKTSYLAILSGMRALEKLIS
ncbi:aspartate dehydrogenase [Candidatus Woesearchaeota archaeon]|nr:aspartate dehydrogenase [Candidatus Woesearchaeota archaeon]